jgi:excinuclease ABC subunit A
VIDMGPEGGDEGGRLMAWGTPVEIAQVEESHTGRFLREQALPGPAKKPKRRAKVAAAA